MTWIEGYIISSEPRDRALELAALFCELMSDDQAAFFNQVANISSTWNTSREFQWRDIQRFLTEDGKNVLNELKEHTDQ